MKTSFEQSADYGVLSLEGELTIEYSAELKVALGEALNSGLNLILEAANVEKTDVTCLQLICSLHRAAVLSGKSLTMRNGGGEFARSIEATGFIRHVGCARDVLATCLWHNLSARD